MVFSFDVVSSPVSEFLSFYLTSVHFSECVYFCFGFNVWLVDIGRGNETAKGRRR